MEEAIKLAIEGGYDGGDINFLIKLPYYARSQIWIDPLFWQSLGRALDWGETVNTQLDLVIDPILYEKAWRNSWHRFIDHLIEGKDPESFFKSLLANK